MSKDVNRLQSLSTEVYYTEAGLVSSGEVLCGLPMSPLDAGSTDASYLWRVSISNDNATFSDEITVLVYDSRCLSCDHVSYSCTVKVSPVSSLSV